MKLTTRFAFVGLLVMAMAVLAACGNTGGGGAGGASTVSLAPDGENLKFDKDTATASAGNVTINFKNSSTANQHNWVLVKGGDAEAQKVDDEGSNAVDKGYIPTDTNIVASIKLLNTGESGSAQASVTAGTYTYLCTYPGHYASGMKGTLTVN